MKKAANIKSPKSPPKPNLFPMGGASVPPAGTPPSQAGGKMTKMPSKMKGAAKKGKG